MASTSSAAVVIVVGAGSVGANVAYRLAREGARVTVLDAAAPGSGASSASFAWTNSFGKPPREYHDLNVAGMDEHERLAEELGGSWFHRSGNLEWVETDEARARLQQSVDRLREWDYPVETISVAEAAALEPDLCFAPGVTGAVYAPRDGWVEVVPMVAALLAAATRAGARVEPGQRVTAFMREGDTIRGVLTATGGRFEGDLVVDCAGHASGELAALAGASVPVDGEPGRLIYTSPVATTLSRPIHAPGVHFRPDGAGRIVLAEQAHDQVVDLRPPESREASGRRGASGRREASGRLGASGRWTPERSLAAAARHLPALAAARVEATRIGVRPMPSDRLPIVGAVPERPGLYIVVSHSGITLGPLWGRVAAGEILGRRPDPRLAPFRATRFA